MSLSLTQITLPAPSTPADGAFAPFRSVHARAQHNRPTTIHRRLIGRIATRLRRPANDPAQTIAPAHPPHASRPTPTLLITLLAALAACSTPPAGPSATTNTATPPQHPRPTATLVHAVPGHHILIPLDRLHHDLNNLNTRSSNPANARDDAGNPWPARAVLLHAAPPSSTATRWLPPTPIWTAVGPRNAQRLLKQPRPAAAALLPALLLDPTPPASPRPAHTLIAGQRVTLRWHRPPAQLSSEPPDAALPRPVGTRTHQLELGTKLANLAQDPFTRWRAALVARRLVAPNAWFEAPTPARPLAPDRLPSLQDPVIAAVADSETALWIAALDKLQRADRTLAARTLGSLTAVVRMPWGTLLPAWPADQSHQQLRLELLDATTDAETRRAAQAWLDRQPPAIAWVIDESAHSPPPHADTPTTLHPPPGVTVAVAELAGEPAILSTATPGEAAVNAAAVAGHAARALFALAGPAPAGPASVIARAGPWSNAVAAVPIVPAPQPPGLPIAPLHPQHSLASWRAGGIPTKTTTYATAARLHRLPMTDRWQLIVECRRPAQPDTPSTDSIRLWLGPFGEPTHTITASPHSPTEPGVEVRTQHDRWLAFIDIPEDAIEPHALLRLALERQLPQQRRHAWPRPLLPGQPEPGRLRLDLARWPTPQPAPTPNN